VTRPCMFVGESRSGGLGKRGAWVGRSGAVGPWSGFKHLRFATPARAALPDSYGSALSRLFGPSHECARSTPQDAAQSRTMSVHGVAHGRAGWLSPSEQCARIAMVASIRRLERMGGRRHAREADRGPSDE
jgi:hypothetical protein